jgi:hypothetical protein
MLRKMDTSVSLCKPQINLVATPTAGKKGEHADGNGTEVYEAGVLVRPTTEVIRKDLADRPGFVPSVVKRTDTFLAG